MLTKILSRFLFGGILVLCLLSIAAAQEVPNGPNWKLADNHRSVTVTFRTTPPAALNLDVSDVEDLLEHLGNIRSNMWPGVPRTFAMGQRVNGIRDPAWVTELDDATGGSILHICDPRYGWLHYLIPRAEALKLVKFLQDQIDSTSPTLTDHPDE